MRFLLFFVIFAGSLNASFWDYITPKEANFAFSAKANAEGEVFDYNIETETIFPNVYSSVEYVRNSGNFYTNHDFKIFNNWKYFGLKARWQRANGFDLNNYQVSGYGIYAGWYSGVLQQWELGEPTTNFLLGKKFTLNVNIFLLPISLIMSQDFISPNFEKWYYETYFKLNLETQSKIVDNVASLFDVEINTGQFDLFIKYTAKDYGNIIWDIKFGGGYRF